MNFKLSTKTPNGTSLQGSFISSFKKLKEILGEPNSKGDGYKVSTEWILEDKGGNVITIYDYKETSLYDGSLPSVEEFRSLEEYDWHIGAKNKEVADSFIEFLQKKHREAKS